MWSQHVLGANVRVTYTSHLTFQFISSINVKKTGFAKAECCLFKLRNDKRPSTRIWWRKKWYGTRPNYHLIIKQPDDGSMPQSMHGFEYYANPPYIASTPRLILVSTGMTSAEQFAIVRRSSNHCACFVIWIFTAGWSVPWWIHDCIVDEWLWKFNSCRLFSTIKFIMNTAFCGVFIVYFNIL